MHADGGICLLWAKAGTTTLTEVHSLPPGGPIRNYKHPHCYITKEKQANNVATSVKEIEMNAHLYGYRWGNRGSCSAIFTKLR
jgi:hypothetical protein